MPINVSGHQMGKKTGNIDHESWNDNAKQGIIRWGAVMNQATSNA